MKQKLDSNYNFLLTGAATHVGQVRKANEDDMATFEVANMKVFVVCDGMGGHVGGKIASQTAITAIREFLINNIMLDPREAIYNSIIAANDAILYRTGQQPELGGMGSTCVMLVVTSEGKVYYGHIGDSRIYIIANHRIKQLTEDHSVVWEMYKAGIITREEMEHHPRKNEITNALGLPNMQPPTLCVAPIEPDSGNCFLLCSDGLTGTVGDEQIQRMISKHEIPIQQRAETLVKMANENGGVDNISVQLVEFAVGTQQIGNNKSKKTENWNKLILFVLPFVLLIAGGTAWWILKQRPSPQPNPSENKHDEIIEKSDSFSNQLSVPITYFTNSIAFTKIGEIFVAEIINFPDNDTIIELSAKTVNKAVRIEKIDGKYITIRWLNESKGNTIEITCITKLANLCKIEIPLVKPDTQVIIPEISDTVNVTLDSISYKLNEPIKISITGKNILLTKGEKKTNNEFVKCDITDAKTIVIHFTKAEYPNPVVVFEKKYRIIIPVKKQKEAPTNENKNSIEDNVRKVQV